MFRPLLVVSLAVIGSSCSPAGRGGPATGGQGGAGADAGAQAGSGGTAGAGGSGGGVGGGGSSGDAAGGPDVGVSWEGGPSCGEATMPIPYDPKTPDVLVVFDHSGSMGGKFGTGTRLSVEQAIVRDLVMTYQDTVRFGYEEFPANTSIYSCPGGAMCCAAPVAVGVDFKNYPPIDTAMKPCGGAPSCSQSRTQTPTPDALRIAKEYYAGLKDGITDRYVLLTTDGEPNCPSSPDACDASVAGIDDLLKLGVKTVVLGVSEEVASSACLERMGAAGGAPKAMAPPSFYPGKDPDTLKKYLGEIIGGLAKPSCDLDLKLAPPDASKIAVYFDGKEVPWDPGHSSGWDYADASHLHLKIYGAFCADLEAFKVKVIDVRFGCPPCGGTVSCG